MLLYSKAQDLYYDPSKASLIEFRTKNREDFWLEEVEEGQPYATLCGDDWYRDITDPKDIDELRRWCQNHTEPLS